jgi:TRAP-type C4-dicarboxylate transport system permease small subunit
MATRGILLCAFFGLAFLYSSYNIIRLYKNNSKSESKHWEKKYYGMAALFFAVLLLYNLEKIL